MLPSGWTEERDDNGDPYYCHIESGKTQWEVPSLEEFVKENASYCGEKNGLSLYILKLTKTGEDSVNFIQRLSIGTKNSRIPSKSVLLVGATGTGKTSLITSLVNKAYGVKYEDKFRIKIIENEGMNQSEDEGKTNLITVYEFNHTPGMMINYNLTIIDTPGLNNPRGIEHDRVMVEHLEKLFTCGEFAINELNCIGIVAKADTNRLTAAQAFVYDSCMRMFGKNVKDIIHIMATFADQSEPNLKDGLKEANVQYVKIHKVNNRNVFLSNEGNSKALQLNKLLWGTIEDSCVEVLHDLETATGKGLALTVKNLLNRREIQERMDKFESEFSDNIRSTLSSIEPNVVNCPEGALICKICQITCHKPCFGNRCKNCKELNTEGQCCKVCSCSFSKHQSGAPFKYEYDAIENRIENMSKLVNSVVELRKCCEELKKVALKDTNNSMEDYFAQLIMKQSQNKDESAQAQISILKTMQQKEDNMQLFLNDDAEMEKFVSLVQKIVKTEKGVKEPACNIL